MTREFDQTTNLDYTMSMFFRQQWVDERLKFKGPRQVPFTYDSLKSIWTPDTFFLNEKYANFHIVTKPNTLLRVENDGSIAFSSRMTVRASCDMDFHLYPFDKQVCHLTMESYSHAVQDLIYTWHNHSVIFDEELSLANYNLLDYSTSMLNKSYGQNEYSSLRLKFLLGRDISHQILNVFVPCVLIVMLSWVSLWIPRDATPARVTLGITTVLTMTTTMINAGGDLPMLSYLTAIDIFTTVCNIFVFSALLEFAFVSFYDKPVYRERRIKANVSQTSNEEIRKQPSWANSVESDEGFVPNPKPSVISNNVHKRHRLERDRQLRHQSWPIAKEDITVRLNKLNYHVTKTGFDPSKVELYTRIMMPILFVLFLITYFITYGVIFKCELL
ncbi:gamma-aminobutyric acid receptor subunit alpha-1-like isoform X2 [Apostichopus japonicus]|uniref:gamma-aminobutyric acid receptor subunit alpha-1-like isoform X2 n=1 Tax=Stichopus japonicus TaxID=307972 RepID=UPI003AB25F9C